MSYAKITSIWVAPLPQKAKADGMSHSDFGLGGFNESMGPTPSFSAATTLTMDLPEDEGPDPFTTTLKSQTIMEVLVKTNGKPYPPGHIIRSLISPHQVLLLNYGRADTWYFAADTFKAADLDKTTINHGPYTLQISTHHKDKVCGTLRWVPPTMSNEALTKALRVISKLEPTITEIPFTNNRNFTIYTDNPSSIPHYIKFNFKNKCTNILISIRGRRQACQYSGSTQHWSNHCRSNTDLTQQLKDTITIETETTPITTPLQEAPIDTNTTESSDVGNITTQIYLSESDNSSEAEDEEQTKSNKQPEGIFIHKYLQKENNTTTSIIEAPSTSKSTTKSNKVVPTPQTKTEASSTSKTATEPKKEVPTPRPESPAKIKATLTKTAPRFTPPPSPKRPRTKTQPKKCPLCNNDPEGPLEQHLDQKHRDILKCRIQLSTNMMDHYANIHPNSTSYTCVYCKNEAAVFTSKAQVQAHLSTWHSNRTPMYDKVNIQLNREANTLIIDYIDGSDN